MQNRNAAMKSGLPDHEAEIHPPVFRKLSKVSVTETDIRKGEWGNYVDKK